MSDISCWWSTKIAPDAAVAALMELGFEFGPPQRATHSVIDTFDGRLHRVGARLGARPVYKPGSADAVELSPHGSALPDQPLVVGRLPRSPSDLPAGQFGVQLGAIVGDRALLVQLTMSSNCSHALRRNRDGKAVARVELHTDVRISDGDGTIRDTDVATWCLELHELPVHRSPAAEPRRRLDGLGLQRLETDSLGWATSIVAIDLSGGASSSGVTLEHTDTATRAFRRVLDQLGDIVAATWRGARDDLDPEFLHDLRIALRKARTVLRSSRGVMPADARRDALDLAGALARQTGAARDLDVHLMAWESHVSALDPSERTLLEPVRELLAVRREQAHARLVEAMDAADRDRWLRRWRELVGATREPSGERPPEARRAAGRVIAQRIEQAHDRMVRDGGSITTTSPSDAVHRLRKDAKHLRYLLESFGSLIAKPHRRAYGARLKAVQDLLGAFQDATVHRALLDDVATELRAAPQATFDALASLTDVVDALGVTLRDDVIASLEAFDSKGTQRALRNVLSDLRT